MKKSIFLIVFALGFITYSASAQSCCSAKTAKETSCCSSKKETKKKKSKLTSLKTERATFTVYGNCGMCKRTIENSLKDVKGVSEANWDGDSHEMIVVFNTKKVSLDEIKQKIADVGYDTDSHRAKDEVYSNLHGCCQYERPKS